MHSGFTVPNGWAYDDHEATTAEAQAAEGEVAAITRIAGELNKSERSLALVVLQAISAWSELNGDKRAA